MSGETPRWVDANVLLRFLTGDPPTLADRASALLEEAEQIGTPLRVHSVVVAEIVWVLQSFYEYPKQDVSDALVSLLDHPALKIEGAKVVIGALKTMAESNVDFADALLAATANSRNGSVVSFDKDFRKLGVEWREPG